MMPWICVIRFMWKFDIYQKLVIYSSKWNGKFCKNTRFYYYNYNSIIRLFILLQNLLIVDSYFYSFGLVFWRDFFCMESNLKASNINWVIIPQVTNKDMICSCQPILIFCCFPPLQEAENQSENKRSNSPHCCKVNKKLVSFCHLCISCSVNSKIHALFCFTIRYFKQNFTLCSNYKTTNWSWNLQWNEVKTF